MAVEPFGSRLNLRLVVARVCTIVKFEWFILIGFSVDVVCRSVQVHFDSLFINHFGTVFVC